MPFSDTNDDGGKGQQYSYPIPMIIGNGLAMYLPPEQEITEAHLAAIHPGRHPRSQQFERRESLENLPRFSLGPNSSMEKHQEEEECESAPAHRPVVNSLQDFSIPLASLEDSGLSGMQYFATVSRPSSSVPQNEQQYFVAADGMRPSLSGRTQSSTSASCRRSQYSEMSKLTDAPPTTVSGHASSQTIQYLSSLGKIRLGKKLKNQDVIDSLTPADARKLAKMAGVYGDVDEDDHPQASSASARFDASVSGNPRTPRTPGRSRSRANSREDSQSRDRSSLRGRSSSHGSSWVDSPGRSRDSSPVGNDDAASSSSRASSNRPSAYPWRDPPRSSRPPRPINPDAQRELMKRNQIILESQKLLVDKARKELAQNQHVRKEHIIADSGLTRGRSKSSGRSSRRPSYVYGEVEWGQSTELKEVDHCYNQMSREMKSREATRLGESRLPESPRKQQHL